MCLQFLELWYFLTILTIFDGRHIEALPNDYVGDSTLPRITSDESINDNGNLLIDFCIPTGL